MLRKTKLIYGKTPKLHNRSVSGVAVLFANFPGGSGVASNAIIRKMLQRNLAGLSRCKSVLAGRPMPSSFIPIMGCLLSVKHVMRCDLR